MSSEKIANRSGDSNLIKWQRSNLSKAEKDKASGAHNKPLAEGFPKFRKSECELVFEGGNNTYIVLGRDRPAGLASGYGGAASTRAGSIDIVVGRGSPNPKATATRGQEVQLWAHPDFYKDAARIYISQKTDIDANFGLVGGSIGSPPSGDADFELEGDPAPRSGIAIKADGVRIIGREGVKIVTGGVIPFDVKNSLDGSQTPAGIDLIAMNHDKKGTPFEVQPLVKGKNLENALEELVSHVDALTGILADFCATQMELNYAIIEHDHLSPWQLSGGGDATFQSVGLMTEGFSTVLNYAQKTFKSLVSQKWNLLTFNQKYLQPYGKDGKTKTSTYINSFYNHTN